jgi:hypothetical protein
MNEEILRVEVKVTCQSAKLRALRSATDQHVFTIDMKNLSPLEQIKLVQLWKRRLRDMSLGLMYGNGRPT